QVPPDLFRRGHALPEGQYLRLEPDALIRKVGLETHQRRKTPCQLDRAYDRAASPEAGNQAAVLQQVESRADRYPAHFKSAGKLLLGGKQRIRRKVGEFALERVRYVNISRGFFLHEASSTFLAGITGAWRA